MVFLLKGGGDALFTMLYIVPRLYFNKGGGDTKSHMLTGPESFTLYFNKGGGDTLSYISMCVLPISN